MISKLCFCVVTKACQMAAMITIVPSPIRISRLRFSLERFFMSAGGLREKTLQGKHDKRIAAYGRLRRRETGEQYAVGFLQAALEIRDVGHGFLEPIHLTAGLTAGIHGFDGEGNLFRGDAGFARDDDGAVRLRL